MLAKKLFEEALEELKIALDDLPEIELLYPISNSQSNSILLLEMNREKN